MKDEWDTYYEKSENSQDHPGQKPTGKGKAYDDALLKLPFAESPYEDGHLKAPFVLDWTLTPVLIGEDIDAKAAHWLMTLLLDRNVWISRECT